MSTALSCVPRIEEPVLPYQEVSNMSVALANQVRMMQSMKSVYQADQQIKFLNLQAEVEILLQQLQNLKHQRSATEGPELASYAKDDN